MKRRRREREREKKRQAKRPATRRREGRGFKLCLKRHKEKT